MKEIKSVRLLWALSRSPLNTESMVIWQDSLLGPLYYVGAGLISLLVIALLVFVVRFFRGNEDYYDDDEDDDFDYDVNHQSAVQPLFKPRHHLQRLQVSLCRLLISHNKKQKKLLKKNTNRTLKKITVGWPTIVLKTMEPNGVKQMKEYGTIVSRSR